MSSRREQQDTYRLPPKYPDDAQGSCLVIGIPPSDRIDEPVALDLVRTVLTAIHGTRVMGEQLTGGDNIRTRIEVFGAVPRELTSGGNVADAVNRVSSGGNGQEQELLRRSEAIRAAVVRAIANEAQAEKEVDVIKLTDKLQEQSSRREFVDGHHAAQHHLNRTLTFTDHMGATVNKVFKQALIDLVPDWVKRGASQDEIERRMNYALAEMLLIIRKVTKQIILFHYPRERHYLPVAAAYMQQIQGFPDAPELLRRYVAMDGALDGLRLPPHQDEFKSDVKVRKRTKRVVPCEPYRVGAGHEDKRILLFPADSEKELKKKIMRDDIPDQEKEYYIFAMIVPILQRMKVFFQGVDRVRRDFETLVPEAFLSSETQMRADPDRLFTALHKLVLEPLEAAIASELQKSGLLE